MLTDPSAITAKMRVSNAGYVDINVGCTTLKMVGSAGVNPSSLKSSYSKLHEPLVTLFNRKLADCALTG